MELDWLQMLKAGIGTLVAILLFCPPFIMFPQDLTQKKRAVLRDFALAVRALSRGAKLAGCCVACYTKNMNREIDMIAHSCGARHAGELERRHVRLVQPAGGSVAPDVLWPLPAQIATTSA